AAIVLVVLPTLASGRSLGNTLVHVAIVAAIVLLGVVSWLVTRWKIEDDDLRIETGLLRRQSLRFPLAQVQAIDIVRPGLARLLGVAELRLRMGGATGGLARLAYVSEREAEPLRERLLSLARGGTGEDVDRLREFVERRLLAGVPTPRLVASILISDVGVVAEIVLAAVIVTALVAPSAAAGVGGGGAVWILSSVTAVWRRFNQEYGLRVTETPEGLQLDGGLVATVHETIRPGRVQAVRVVEPLLWRLLGWCRLEVDLAGRQRSGGEAQEARRAVRALLPVGRRDDAEALLERLVPDRPHELDPPPRRARWKSPLRYRMLGWASTSTCVQTRSGRLRRVTCWVPLEKAQSFRRVQGPVQRRFRLASVHVDTAGRNVHAVLRDRDADEADAALEQLAGLARAARA
ncbi:MAG TPA: PH domain-containing protein, partial [Gaiellaceae bacterium]